MKFSKESHRKTGVGVHENKGPEGLLYKDPNKGKEETLEEIVKRRANSTKRLFNLFGTGENAKDISKEAKEIAKGINSAVNKLKANTKNNHEEEINNNLSAS